MLKPKTLSGFLYGIFAHIIAGCFILSLASNSAFSQEQTINNYNGVWSDNASWLDGTAPGTTNLNVNVSIYGNIQLYSGVSFNTGNLYIYDTLTIFGNLTLATTADLTIAAGGVLIVRGNYTSGDNTDVTIAAGGRFVVTGEFLMQGVNTNGTFDNTNGFVYLFDATPTIKTGVPNYSDILCTPFGAGCGYGTSAQMEDDPIWSFYNSGGFVISASGPTSFCAEGSVILTTSTACSGYQWFLDGSAISGATTNSYTATSSGTYTIGFTYGGNIFSIDTAILENQIPIPSIDGDFYPYSNTTCLYATDEAMTAYNWVVTGGSILSGQGTNAVQVTWGTAGAGTIQVTYTTQAGCTGSSPIIDITKADVLLSCFQYRRNIAINQAMVSGGAALTNFPVLIRIQDNSLRHTYYGGHITQFNGYDIMFTSDIAGTNLLYYQIDNYNPQTGELNVWVRIPSLSASAPTNIYLFYSNYSITTNHSSALTWGNDYVNILHMGSNLHDDAQSENNGINYGTEVVTGKIGKGRQFNRTEKDFIQLLNEADFNFHGQTTVSFWMRLDSYPTTTWMDYIVKGDNVNWRFVGNRTNTNMYYAFGTGGTDNGYTADLNSNNGTVTAGANWYYVVGTFDGSGATNIKRIYINGVVREQTTPGTPLPDDLQSYHVNNEPVLLGINSQADDQRAFSGTMDEVRISNSFKSPGWILTEYNNQNNPNNPAYISIGSETQLYNPTAIGGTVDVDATFIYAREFTTATLTGSNGAIQWQKSVDNINFCDLPGETETELISEPLLSTTYYRALVGSGGCSLASNTDSVIVRAAFFDCVYGQRKRLVITEDKVPGTDDLTDFPVLVSIQNNNDLRLEPNGYVSNSNGYDIIFTASDGITQLSHQLESYDPVNGSITAWVKLPTVYALDSTVFFIYYGDPSRTTDPSSNETFSSDYIGVYHMGNAVTTPDATGHGNDGANTNNPLVLTGASAMINTASGFNGSNQYITLANESAFDIAPNGKMTISAWIYVNSFNGTYVEQFVDKGTNGWFLRESNATSTDPQFYQTYRGSDYIEAHNNAGLTTGSWHYLVSAFDHATNNAVVYIDGSCANSVKNDPATNLIHCNNIQVRLAAMAGGIPGGYLNGRLDEVRIQNVYRSSNWITTEYNNQLNPTNFILVRDEDECTTDPNPGTASADYNIVCRGLTTQITLTGYSGSIYWQSSPDNINWSYIRGRSSATLTVGPLTDTMYYRAAVSSCCELFSNSVRIDFVDVDPPLLSFAVTDANCPGATNGSIDMSISNGLPGFSINWSNGATTEDLVAVGAGTYNVTVLDGNLCRVRGNSVVSDDDVIPPVAVCTSSPVIVPLDTYGNGTLMASVVDGGSTDICDASLDLTLDVSSFTCSEVGPQTVVLTATDDAGNSSTCSKSVTVSDNIVPTITCPANINTTTNSGCTATGVALGTPTTGDNCGVFGTSNDAPASYPIGNTTVIWTVTDVNGNTASCNQTITVSDTEIPTITCPSTAIIDATVGSCSIASGSVSLGTPTTGDNCGVASTINDAPANYPVGNTTVTWTVTDIHGNTNTCTQTVTVIDNQVPTITCPSTVTVNAASGLCSTASGSVTLGTPTTGDNCGVASTINDAPANYPVGNTTVTWTVTDIHGNTNTCPQTVTIIDDQAPTITCPSNVTIDATAGLCSIDAGSVTLGTPTTGDNCGVSGTSNNAPVSYAVGNTTVIWTVTDINGNTASCNQTVTVNDSDPPVINCPSDISTESGLDSCSAIVSWTEPDATDNCGGIITIVRIDTSGIANGGIFPYGITTISYRAVDSYGNADTCSFDVIVNGDNMPPEISNCPANIGPVAMDSGICGALITWSDPGVSDNCDLVPVIQRLDTTGFNSGDIFPAGITTISYIATDAEGNLSTCSFTITVEEDSQAPIFISCPANIGPIDIDITQCGAIATWIDPVATDNCDGDLDYIRSDITGLNSGDLFPEGITTISYNAIDDQGNSATCLFTIEVHDSILPIISCRPDTSLCSTETNTVNGISPLSFSDNCGFVDRLALSYMISGSTIANGTGDASGSIFEVGQSTLVYTIADISGNTATCSSVVEVLASPLTGTTTSDEYNAGNDPMNHYIALLCYGMDQDVTYTNIGSTGISFEWSFDGNSIDGTTNSVSINHQNEASGGHSITTIIIDANGCQSVLANNILISNPEVDLGSDASICYGEQYTFIIEGSFEDYFWNGISGNSSFSTAQAGQVTLRVIDTLGCDAYDTANLFVHGIDPPIISQDTVVCENDFEIETILDPLNTDWQYSHNIPTGNSDRYIFVIQDPYLCQLTDTINLLSCNPEDVLFIPNYITPDNNDGLNDYWEIGNIDKFPNNSIEIYDRAGRLVFKRDNYDNSRESEFKGIDSKGRILPMDSYFYIIDLKNARKPIDGNITIIR